MNIKQKSPADFTHYIQNTFDLCRQIYSIWRAVNRCVILIVV